MRLIKSSNKWSKTWSTIKLSNIPGSWKGNKQSTTTRKCQIRWIRLKKIKQFWPECVCMLIQPTHPISLTILCNEWKFYLPLDWFRSLQPDTNEKTNKQINQWMKQRIEEEQSRTNKTSDKQQHQNEKGNEGNKSKMKTTEKRKKERVKTIRLPLCWRDRW